MIRHALLTIGVCLVARSAFAIADEEYFLRADADDNGSVEQADATFILDHLYEGGDAPNCADAADANDDGDIQSSDATYILEYLYNGGPQPPAPGPTNCGDDPTSDNLDCAQSGCP